MKQADPSKGFFLCFISNMAIHFWWGLAAILMVILHLWKDIPWFFTWIACVVWGCHALIMTALAYWANRSSQKRSPARANKNPYSTKNEDVFPSQDNDAEGKNED